SSQNPLAGLRLNGYFRRNVAARGQDLLWPETPHRRIAIRVRRSGFADWPQFGLRRRFLPRRGIGNRDRPATFRRHARQTGEMRLAMMIKATDIRRGMV